MELSTQSTYLNTHAMSGRSGSQTSLASQAEVSLPDTPGLARFRSLCERGVCAITAEPPAL
jgi:hypothetical protein